MTTLLLGFKRTTVLLLPLAGKRPLLLECPPELRRAASAPSEVAAPAPRTAPRPEHAREWHEDLPPAERPRSPEQQIDPRTVFKRRATVPTATGLRTRASEPPTMEASEDASHDHMIVPGNHGFRASEQGIQALVTYLRTAQILVAKHQRVTPTGTSIELLPNAFSHLAFTEGAAPAGTPSILEGTLWFGNKPLALPFGDPTRTCFLRLELVGTRFARVSEAFLGRLHQILHLKPEVLVAAHDPVRLRTKSTRLASEAIPRFDLQEV